MAPVGWIFRKGGPDGGDPHADVAERRGVALDRHLCPVRTALVAFEHREEQVMQAVRELDYHPNTAARSLASPVLRTVGYFYSGISAFDH